MRESGVDAVSSVHLRIGELAGVSKEALHFGYEIATKDTLLEGSQLVIEEVPVIVYCAHCATEKRLESVQLFRCPTCGTPTAEIRQGRELELVSLEIDDYETAHS